MSTPQIMTLRPRRVGQLLDQAFRLYRRNFIKFIAIIAIVQIPVSAVQLTFSLLVARTQTNLLQNTEDLFAAQGDLFSNFISSIGFGLLSILLSLVLIQGVGMAALTRAITDSMLGESVSIGGAFRKIGTVWLRLLGTILLIFLLLILAFVWLLVPCVGWLTGLGIIIVITSALLPIAAPVVVLENKGGFKAIRRSWDLVRRRFWWVLGVALILYLFNYILSIGPASLVTFIALGITRDSAALASQTIGNAAIQSITTLLVSLIYLPLQITVFCLVYFDLRVRTEGIDLALQAEEPGDQAIEFADLIVSAPEVASDTLVTAKEMGYFALMTLLLVAIYLVILFPLLLLLGLLSSSFLTLGTLGVIIA